MRILKIESPSIFLTIFLGLLPISLFATIWGFFFRINVEITIFLFLITAFLYYHQKGSIAKEVGKAWLLWRQLSKGWKASIIAFILLTAYQSAMPTNIPDEGYYYLQSVKWANQVGIPLGVAKYGVQYGQFSSWHLLQAGLNLGALFGNVYNNLNGWLIIIFALWSIQGIKNGQHTRRLYYIFCLATTIPLYYFVTAPSPDLPVILLSLIFFELWLFGNRSTSTVRVLIVLALAAIMMKLSAFFLFFFVVSWIINDWKSWRMLAIGSLAVGSILITKSTITTGAPFYPITSATLTFFSWKVDNLILEDGKTVIKNSPVIKNSKSLYEKITSVSRWKRLIGFGGYRGVLNGLWLLGMVLVLVLGLIKRDKKLQLLFILSFVHALILFVISPNYRFALPVILLNAYIIMDFILSKWKMDRLYKLGPIILLLTLIWFTPLIGPVLQLSSNSVISIRYSPAVSYLLVPSKPFISDNYEQMEYIRENVFVPPGYHYCWDGPLPCVMRRHVEKYNK